MRMLPTNNMDKVDFSTMLMGKEANNLQDHVSTFQETGRARQPYANQLGGPSMQLANNGLQ